MVDLSQYQALLDDSPFEEIPVGLSEFIGPGYLDQDFVLSEIQRDLVECMSQIYTLEDCQRVYGIEEGIAHYQKYTKKEVIMQLGKGSNIGSDEVYLSDKGEWARIDSLQSSFNNEIMGTSDGKMISQYATESFCEGVDETFEVELERGLKVTVTPNHAFYDKDLNRVKLKDCRVGDRIAVTTKTSVSNPVRLDDRVPKLLGYWIGDGCMPKDLPQRKKLNQDFGVKDAMAMQEYLSIADSFGDSPRVVNFPNGKQMHCVWSNSKDRLVQIAKDFDLWEKNAGNKLIPDAIFNAPDDQVADFISRLWGCDGTVYKKGKSYALEYCTISEQLAVGLQRLLTRFGILASLRSRYPTYTYKGVKKQGQLAYYLTISDRLGIERFVDNITLLDKQYLLDEAIKVEVNAKTTNYLGDLYFAKIKAVKGVGPQPVFTMSATETGNFNQNLVLNGNSGK